MKIVVNENQNIAKSLVYSLTTVVGLAADTVQLGKATTVTTAEGCVYKGLMAVIAAVRQSPAADASANFLSGSNAEQKCLINQWLGFAAVLATLNEEAAAVPLQEAAQVMEMYLKQGFLADTPRASIADVLVYAAIHNGRVDTVTTVPASVMAWSVRAHEDALLAPIRCKSVKVTTKAGKGTKTGVTNASGFIKPSPEEIKGRRLAKEKAKAAKEATKAAAGQSSGATVIPPREKHADPVVSKKGGSTMGLNYNALDIRVGQFTNVRSHPEADRLYVEDMNMGTETRTIVSGLVEHFKDPKDLEGKLILVLCNMKAKTLKGVTSHGMILCASNEEGLALVSPPDGAQPGDRICFGDGSMASKPTPEVLSGNKMTDLLAQLHTDDAGVLCWKDVPAHHARGIISVPNKKNCIVK